MTMMRKGLMTAWLVVFGFASSACTITTTDDDDDKESVGDDDADDDADDDSGSGGAGGAGEGAQAGQAGSGETNQAGSDGGQEVAQSDLAQIEGATFVEGGRPDTTGDQTGPTLQSPDFVINGGTGQYTVELSDDAEFILVGIEGDNGYYKIPVTSTGSTQSVAITLLQDYSQETLGVLVALQDEAGDVSAWTSDTVEVVETAAGDLKVSLSFNESEDLDLYVMDPSGDEVFYGVPTLNGGNLDLDSNAGCADNLGVNNENITWDGSETLRGEYTVRVNYYQQCSAASVDYIVTVSIGNDVRTYTGTFNASDQGETQVVTTFTY